MSLKWESFLNESIKFKKSSCGITTYALDIYLAGPCLIRTGILLFLNVMFETSISISLLRVKKVRCDGVMSKQMSGQDPMAFRIRIEQDPDRTETNSDGK